MADELRPCKVCLPGIRSSVTNALRSDLFAAEHHINVLSGTLQDQHDKYANCLETRVKYIATFGVRTQWDARLMEIINNWEEARGNRFLRYAARSSETDEPPEEETS